jgi:hypothetical protein
MTQAPAMKSIWYFVGLVLLAMGGLVFVAGLIDFMNKTGGETVLAHTYPAIWWGGIMVAAGLVFYLKHRNAVHD